MGNVSIYILWKTFLCQVCKELKSENSDMVGSKIHISGKSFIRKLFTRMILYF